MNNLDQILKQVSRSFYLSLKFLPKQIRPSISIAYLIARASDTLADTAEVPVGLRLQSLREMQHELVAGKISEPFQGQVREFMTYQKKSDEKQLLKHYSEIFRALFNLESHNQRRILNLIETIIAGQLWDLEYFKVHSSDFIKFTENEMQLDQYLYSVAGCVGDFWTQMGLAHFSDYSSIEPNELVQLGVDYGKGLQLTNILRDIVTDARLNRCYFPLYDQHLIEQDSYYDFLLEHKNRLENYRELAIKYLERGLIYANSLRVKRIKFACYLPAKLGLDTLNMLKGFDYIFKRTSPKVTRPRVYQMMFHSFFKSIF